LKNLYRASYHSFSKIAHGDYTFAKICRRGEHLQGDVVGSITLFACLAGRIAIDLFDLEERYWDDLRRLHPDLENQKELTSRGYQQAACLESKASWKFEPSTFKSERAPGSLWQHSDVLPKVRSAWLRAEVGSRFRGE
jgi:hypothetical protein